MGNRDQPAARGDEVGEPREVDASVAGERQHAQARAASIAQQLPGNEVAVVLGSADDDLVGRREPRAESLREDIDRRGGAGSEHHLFGARR